MTSRDSLRERLRELEARGAIDLARDPCQVCGGAAPGTDVRERVTVEFATLECTCDVDLPTGARRWSP